MADRLKGHPSPYLEQHADNPVDWWPWSQEAFEEARRRDVPVFLSIGYATCHWCHVMAHESFEDDEAAKLLNEAFVCIKVDREERPDIDDTYMAAMQASGGRGGWPLTVVLDHEKRPWFTATYIPKHGRGRHMGLMDLVPRLTEAWQTKREEIERSAQHLISHLDSPRTDPERPPADLVAQAAKALAARFDPEHGGFGQAPKFPSPHQITLLLRHGTEPSIQMARATLDAMAAGGIHDHVGGGFHRYSTDRTWLLPHFEKMLYDQATLLDAYTQAWQRTQDPQYQTVAEGIVTYVLRDLRHAKGGFFSGEDADSEGEEGTFYVWHHDELTPHLNPTRFGARPGGNFHDEATGQPDPRNILHVPAGTELASLRPDLDRLLAIRSKRIRPLRDEKILADWNGIWITSLARAAMAFERNDWLDAAADGGRFLLDEMDAGGQLRHRWREGVVDDDAFLDDHAGVGLAFVTLFEATGDGTWLQPAEHLAERLTERFQDGAFLLAPKDGAFRLARRAEAYDGAMPSGNSLAVAFLARLGRITDASHLDAAWTCVDALGTQVRVAPQAYCALAQALADLDGREVVISDPQLWSTAWQAFAPDALRIKTGATGVPWIEAHETPAAYVCRQQSCQAPVYDAESLRAALA